MATSWIIPKDPTSDDQWGLVRDAERRPCEEGRRDWSYAAINQGMPEAGEPRKDPPLKPCRQPDVGLWPPPQWCLSHGDCSNLHSQQPQATGTWRHAGSLGFGNLALHLPVPTTTALGCRDGGAWLPAGSQPGRAGCREKSSPGLCLLLSKQSLVCCLMRISQTITSSDFP